MWPLSKSSASVPSSPDWPFGTALAAILESLQSLRQAKSAHRVFGADAHGFKLNPPLNEGILARFESTHRVRLPEDYRSFLLHAGNGGAGPGYGLFKFLEVDDGYAARTWHESDGLVGVLSQPFPHSGAWNDLTGRPDIGEPGDLTTGDEDARWAEVDAWRANNYFHSRHVDGAIPICHLGCAIRHWLVITGDEAGHVWTDDRANDNGIFPVQIGASCRVSFLQWYSSWLTDSLRQSALLDGGAAKRGRS